MQVSLFTGQEWASYLAKLQTGRQLCSIYFKNLYSKWNSNYFYAIIDLQVFSPLLDTGTRLLVPILTAAITTLFHSYIICAIPILHLPASQNRQRTTDKNSIAFCLVTLNCLLSSVLSHNNGIYPVWHSPLHFFYSLPLELCLSTTQSFSSLINISFFFTWVHIQVELEFYFFVSLIFAYQNS